jgi:uncharacterized membrane protein YkoI
MKKFATLSAILLLAAPDLAWAQSRGRDGDDDRGGRAERSREDDGNRNRGKGKGNRGDGPRAERPRGDGPGRNQGRGQSQYNGQNRGRGGDDARTAVREGRRVSLREVLPQIQRRTPGRMLDSYPETGPGGRPQYRVRWLSENGQRIDYIVDAETGAIIRRE